jgi:hypothetical protein
MHPATKPPAIRRDGWTPQRRQQFLAGLAAGLDVRGACAGVGLSREGAYKLRRRDAAFARAWDEAQRQARRAAELAFLASLPPELLRALSRASRPCEHRGPEFHPRTPSHP